jgi:hypothetical protein
MNYAEDLLCAWPAPVSFNPSLVDSNFLGYVVCEIPGNAKPGDSYSLQFSFCDGAPDLETQYDLESFQARIWVASAPKDAPSNISDEWKIQFFSDVNAANAADSADPDGDGATNLQEYLAGTNPAQKQSYLHLTSTVLTSKTGGVKLEWLSAPDKNYVVESSDTLNGSWSPIATASGTGDSQQITITNNNAQLRFYRLRLQP